MQTTDTRKPWDYQWPFSFFSNGEPGWLAYHVDTGREEEVSYELAMLIREYNRLWEEVRTIEGKRGL